jgi:hypothetical protein
LPLFILLLQLILFILLLLLVVVNGGKSPFGVKILFKFGVHHVVFNDVVENFAF